jgi:hypothetical protein
MVLNALKTLGDCAAELDAMMDEFDPVECYTQHHHGAGGDSHHDHSHDHHAHSHAHGRSYHDVKHIIGGSNFTEGAKNTALNIYAAIAKAEAEVHGATLETVHFHEVGRDEAIGNALGIGMALEAIAPDKVVVSDIYDGRGTIVCSHGEIPVPVPAVAAMMKETDYIYKTAPVDTEMVTPSGLASIIGMEAIKADGIDLPQGRVLDQTEAKGSRDTGRPGLRVYLIEE